MLVGPGLGRGDDARELPGDGRGERGAVLPLVRASFLVALLGLLSLFLRCDPSALRLAKNDMRSEPSLAEQ